MSTAMALHNQRAGDRDLQGGSEQVQRRSTELLRHLEPVAVKKRLETLLAASAAAERGGAEQAVGNDRAFLDRWGYDLEQRKAIAAAIEAVAD